MNTSILTKEEYPFLLTQIPNLPKEMHIAGSLPNLEHKYLCVIGSRNYSSYGKDVCTKLIRGLKGHPITIVSGLAIGIDSISHEAAIETGLNTIAFPGSGLSLEALYPSSRRRLAEKIIQSGGTLLSPFKMDQTGAFWTFPFRNRLMAGISHATLIIEARKGSGTLLTAEYAAEINREILAVPGSIFGDLSYGPHMLIKRGATPITSSEDILEALGFPTTKESGQQSLLSLAEVSLSTEEKSIVNMLKISPRTGSDIIETLQFDSSTFNMYISELELKRIIEERAGLYCIKNS